MIMVNIIHYKCDESMILNTLEENKVSKEPQFPQDNDAWRITPQQYEQFSKSQNSMCSQADIHRAFLNHAKELRDQDQSLNEHKATNKEISSNGFQMPLNTLWLP